MSDNGRLEDVAGVVLADRIEKKHQGKSLPQNVQYTIKAINIVECARTENQLFIRCYSDNKQGLDTSLELTILSVRLSYNSGIKS